MIISDILRKLLTLLSFWYPNRNISKKKDKQIRKIVLKEIDKININKKNLKKTHLEFNQKIFELLKNKNIKNFLRESFIQKVFFLHNRLFVYKELQILQKSKKWNFYKKILEEDNIGNPIRYFLYLKSSGNRINHVYHLNLLENQLRINIRSNVKKVYEFGGGYGCMARIFSKINKSLKYTCFDTSYVNLLQYYYLKHNNLNVGFSKKNKIYLTSKISGKEKNIDLFIANWSLSETPISFRKKMINNIRKSKFILISFQEKFEDIDNLKYFQNIRKQLKNTFKIKIIKNEFYNGNIFNRQNHYFFLGRRV